VRNAADNEGSTLAGAAYGATASLIWAGFPAITKLSMASHTLDAWDVTALRFGVGGLILLPLFLRRGLGTLGWLRGLLLACGAGAPYVLLTAGGLAFAPAGHMGVMTPSTMLLCSALGSWLILGDRLTAGRFVGVATIFLGLVMLGWDGLTNHGDRTWIGDAMFVVGGLFWASYTIASRAWRVEPLHATAIVAALSLLIYTPPYLLATGSHLAAAPWREILIQGVFQGVLSAVVALLFYTRSVALLGAARGAVFGALVPSFSLLIAIPLLHETPTAPQIVGVALVTLGMLFALGLHDPAKWRRAAPAAAATPAPGRR
jgi:drug/metabolite transporter (DMT)-like permease